MTSYPTIVMNDYGSRRIVNAMSLCDGSPSGFLLDGGDHFLSGEKINGLYSVVESFFLLKTGPRGMRQMSLIFGRYLLTPEIFAILVKQRTK